MGLQDKVECTCLHKNVGCGDGCRSLGEGVCVVGCLCNTVHWGPLCYCVTMPKIMKTKCKYLQIVYNIVANLKQLVKIYELFVKHIVIFYILYT